jgi:hypothetical protein
MGDRLNDHKPWRVFAPALAAGSLVSNMTGTVAAGVYTPSGPVDSPLVPLLYESLVSFQFSVVAGSALPSGSITIYGGLVSGSLVPLTASGLTNPIPVSGTAGMPWVLDLGTVSVPYLSARYTHLTGAGQLSGWVNRKGA